MEREGFGAGKVTRRRLLEKGAVGGALVALAPLVAACAPAASPSSSASPAATAAAASAAQSAAAAAPRKGGTLRVGIASNIPDFDAQQSVSYLTQHPTAPFYNMLIQSDDQMKGVVPDLAESWTISPDGKTYTFKLRQGVKFHNGDVLTSADIQYSLQRMINPPTGILSPRKANLANIKSIDTPDANTVILHLGVPQPELLFQLASPYNVMFSKKFTQPLDAAGTGMKRQVNGTGPFKLKNYVEGQILEMERNPDYFMKDQPLLDGIQYFIIKGEQQVAAALQSDRIDGLFLMADPGLSDKLRAEGYDSRFRPFVVTANLYPNTKRKPFDDIRVRQAIALGIDHAAYLKVLGPLAGHSLFSRGLLHPNSGFDLTKEQMASLEGGYDTFPDGGGNLDKNRAKAKELLAAAGAGGLKIDMPTRNDIPQYRDASITIAEQLKGIGLNASVRVLDPGTFAQTLAKGDYDMTIYTASAQLPVVDQLLSFYVSKSGQNYSGHTDASFDDLYAQQSQETDPAKRKALLEQFQLKFLKTFYVIPQSWGTIGYAFNKRLQGFPTPDYAFNSYMRFDRSWLKP